ncbi:hypothetical protein ABT099_23405 [Streptomyces prasinus]|uniref:hypothetical protein n=1 Tax=Streptomyces prasinus TaxID=67345 RepID=UPI0033188DB2
MRGKQGNAAKNRRDRTELEQRAVKAEQRAERLEKELVDLRESSQRRIGSLRVELGQALKERDLGAAPALSKAEERIRALTEERDQIADQLKLRDKRWHALDSNLRAVMRGMGLTDTEAIETLIAAYEPDGKARTVVHNVRQARSTDQTLAVERARGQRSRVDPLSARRLPDRSLEERKLDGGGSEVAS